MINEATFNFDKYDWTGGSITGKGLENLLNDTATWTKGKSTPVGIYDRQTNKLFNIVDALISRDGNLELHIDLQKAILENNQKDSGNIMNENDELKDKFKEAVALKLDNSKLNSEIKKILTSKQKIKDSFKDDKEVLTALDKIYDFVDKNKELYESLNEKKNTSGNKKSHPVIVLLKGIVRCLIWTISLLGSATEISGVVLKYVGNAIKAVSKKVDNFIPESENSPLIKGTGYKGTDSSTANTLALDTVVSTVIDEKDSCDKDIDEEIEEALKEIYN